MYEEFNPESLLRSPGECDVCHSAAFRSTERRPEGALTLVICQVCGKYRLDWRAEELLGQLQESSSERLHILSHILRLNAERNRGKKDNTLFPILTNVEVDRMLQQAEPTVAQKLGLLLNAIAKRSTYPGQLVKFDPRTDYPLLCAHNAAEVEFFLRSLRDQSLIKHEGMDWTSVSAAGWNEIEKQQSLKSQSDTAFIAMWFHASQSEAEAAITSAIAESGYSPIRIDRVEHLNRIDDEIISRIRQAKFLVADFTGHRNGVYFEAGFMLGLGKPVIWLCEKNAMGDLHFDTRQYNTIDYISPDDLRKRLSFRIQAVIGVGPTSRSS